MLSVSNSIIISIYHSCRVFQPTKNAFVDTLRSVVADVKWFLLFLVLTMWGFAGAFYILFREDQQQYQVCVLSYSKCMPMKLISYLLLCSVCYCSI